MSASKQVRVALVQIEPNGRVLINVVPGVNVDGEVHEGQFENVHSTLVELGADLAKQVLDAAAKVVAAQTVVAEAAVPEVPEVPGVPAVMDGEKEVTAAVAAIPAVPAIPEKRKPRFEGRAVVVA